MPTSVPFYRLFFAMLILFLLVSIIPVTASEPSVIVSDYKVTPSVLLPGEQGIVSVTVKNTAGQATISQSYSSGTAGNSATTTTNVDINAPIDSVTMVGNGVDVISGGYNRVGELGPGQSIPITFLIQAPDQPGVYFPEVWIRVSDATSLKFPIPVNVNSEVQIQKKPQVTVDKQLPASVMPGNDFNATVSLANNGQLSASNLQVTVTTSNPSITPKTPGTYHIEKLGPGEQKNLYMEFSTDKKSPLGISPVNLVIDYQNPDGTFTRQVETLGVNIRGQAQLDISQITTDPARISKGDQFTLYIRVENTGTDDAKSVNAKIDLPLPGTKEAFVGKIEPNNDAPAPFNLQADRSGDIPYILVLEYTDDYGPHQAQQELHLNVYNKDSTPVIIGAVILLILAGGFAYWFLVFRKKETANV
ncbi:MAG: CARDB domain-containing protein [Methanomicrobiales archaeon]